MSQPLRAFRAGLIRVFLVAVLLAGSWPSSASAARRRGATPDVAHDFAALAQQRSWTCKEQESFASPGPGWRAEPAQCAWQDRLRMRRWASEGDTPAGACVSPQASWWSWARGALVTPAGPPPAWRAEWDAQSLDYASGDEQHILIIRRLANGQWSATEWRWNPSTRAATRRWQAGRWKLLSARAETLRKQAEPGSGVRETRMLRDAWEASLGTRAGEIAGDVWQWRAEGLCLRVDAVGLGQQQLHLPYSVDDTRLEQRAAMQLQLARRYPKAAWLTTFRLVPGAPHARGGAKFFAVWLENTSLKGQLWIPTKGDGPLVRIRIDSTLPAGQGGQPAPATVARASQVIERELAALATRWTVEHE